MSDTVLETPLTIYTDGGCHGNPGPGGWAWRAINPMGAVIACDNGGENLTTNNRMELSAVINGLQWAIERHVAGVVMYTDSQYVKQGITAWIHNWKRNGWRTSTKKPVKNAELWRELDRLNACISAEWKWVKGHAGNEHNEACDLAVQEAIAAL